MAKKKTIDNYDDVFNDLIESQKEVEELLKQATETTNETPEAESTQGKKQDIINYAYGVHKNVTTNKWEVVELIFDPLTSDAKVNDVLMTSINKAVAQMKAGEFIARRLNNLTIPEKQKRG
jgi:hypothetical protein